MYTIIKIKIVLVKIAVSAFNTMLKEFFTQVYKFTLTVLNTCTTISNSSAKKINKNIFLNLLKRFYKNKLIRFDSS